MSDPDLDAIRREFLTRWSDNQSVTVQVRVLRNVVAMLERWEVRAHHERARADRLEQELDDLRTERAQREAP